MPNRERSFFDYSTHENLLLHEGNFMEMGGEKEEALDVCYYKLGNCQASPKPSEVEMHLPSNDNKKVFVLLSKNKEKYFSS